MNVALYHIGNPYVYLYCTSTSASPASASSRCMNLFDTVLMQCNNVLVHATFDSKRQCVLLCRVRCLEQHTSRVRIKYSTPYIPHLHEPLTHSASRAHLHLRPNYQQCFTRDTSACRTLPASLCRRRTRLFFAAGCSFYGTAYQCPTRNQ